MKFNTITFINKTSFFSFICNNYSRENVLVVFSDFRTAVEMLNSKDMEQKCASGDSVRELKFSGATVLR